MSLAPAGTARPAEHELVITRVFDAPRRLVFKVWTDPRHISQWWGPRYYPSTQIEMDVRPGGGWRNCLKSTETGEEIWQEHVANLQKDATA